MKNHLHRARPLAALLALALAGAACHSNIVPLRPLQRVDMVETPDGPIPADTLAAATEPATAPSTQIAATSPATEPATQPGRRFVKIVDPNQTARFIYKADYDNIWQQSMILLTKAGFALDRKDYRLGVMSTQPLPSAQIVEFWKPQHANPTDAMENTVNSQRRIIRLSIAKVEAKPDFYEIAIQVLVERETNPSEGIGGPVFIEGSGFGRNAVALRSDYVGPVVEKSTWIPLGHDPNLERKLIDQLFNRI